MSKIMRRKPNLLACQASSLMAPWRNNFLEERFKNRAESGKGINSRKRDMSVYSV